MRRRPWRQVCAVTLFGVVASTLVAPKLLSALPTQNEHDSRAAVDRVIRESRLVGGRLRQQIHAKDGQLLSMNEGVSGSPDSRGSVSTTSVPTVQTSSAVSTVALAAEQDLLVMPVVVPEPGIQADVLVTTGPTSTGPTSTGPTSTGPTTTGPTTTGPTAPNGPTTTAGPIAEVPVSYVVANVRVTEGQNATFTITANRAQAVDVQIQLVAGSGTARADDYATGRDVTVPASAVMKAGATSLRIELPTIDDEIRELDEHRMISFVQLADPVALASGTVTIIDNDSKEIVNIRNTGALGDGRTDDTAAIQRAVDQVHAAGGGVVTFPPGIYVTRSVAIHPGLTFLGQGGVLKRPAGQGKWVRTFTTDGNQYKGEGLSEPLVIDGMIFDGNRQQQSEYRNYELEQAHLVMLAADPQSPGQLRAFVHNTTFRDGVGDGLSVYTNVNVVVTQSSAHDVFRGGLVVGGGNTDVVVDGFTTTGPELATGIDFEIDGPGFGGSLTVRATLTNMDIDADFDIGVGESNGSRISVDRLVMRNGPFTSFTPNANVRITNSLLHFGGVDIGNRILFPYDMTIESSQIIVTPDPAQQFSAVDVWFGHREFAAQPFGVLRFRNVDFIRGPGGSSPTFGVYQRVMRPGDQIVYDNVTFDPGFVKPVGP
jgi:hypothetical protein